jgi:beta-N-acetylhexosaminidase
MWNMMKNENLVTQNLASGFSQACLVALIAIAIISPICLRASTGQADAVTNADQMPTDTKLSEADELILAKMSLRQKVGQMLMVGFNGAYINEGLDKVISEVRPGSIIVFGRNIKSARQISNLNLLAQKQAIDATLVPLLIAVDQEGGNVMRLKTHIPLPSALAFGSFNDPALTERAGRATGLLLKTLGFSMNLAPVFDLASPLKKSFIGTRAFGDNPERVANLGINFARGLQASGILPTSKHFPGHGDLAEDTHLAPSAKNSSLSHLQKFDLAPFFDQAKKLTAPSAIMVAHISYPALDTTDTPASFSKPVVTDLLRHQINFDGIVLTDDIKMDGASVVGSPSERAIRAIEAGVDIVMVAWGLQTQIQVANAITEAVRSGRIKQSRIDESLRRILLAKRRYASWSTTPPTNIEVSHALHNQEFDSIAELIINSRFSETSISQLNKALPDRRNQEVFVFSSSPKFYKSFLKEAKGLNSKYFQLKGQDGPAIDKIIQKSPGASAVFHVTGDHAAGIINRLNKKIAGRILVVNTQTRAIINKPKDFAAVVDVYSQHPELGKFAAKYFFAQPQLIEIK